MAKISQQQIDSINAKCKNGFSFDTNGFEATGRKKLIKTIIIKEEKKMIEATLDWIEDIKRWTDKDGKEVIYNTQCVFPQLQVSFWTKEKDTLCWELHAGTGRYHNFKDTLSERKKINWLCEVTGEVTEELLYSLLPEQERDGLKHHLQIQE